MNHRTKGILLVGSLAVATAIGLSVAPSVVLSVTLIRALDHGPCGFGLRNLIIGCTFKSQSRTVTGPSHPTDITASSAPATAGPRTIINQASWDVTDRCPLGDIAKRLFCAGASAAAPAPDDLEVELSKATGLPLPKGRVLTTENNSPFIKAVHVEAPLDLAAVLGFYRDALRKRGWTEDDGAVVAPDRAIVAFTTSDGPALLRLTHQDGRTIADLSLRKPAAVAKTEIVPSPGRVKLLLGNATDEAAVVTVNAQAIKLAARAGHHVMESGHKLPDGPQIDLPPGKFKVSLMVANNAAQQREFEVGADETWGLLVGPAGVPLPVHLY